ncbi:phosphotransferase [Streptomyces sp. NBC_01591]|uniref:phosphotransferase n=1 Tax=Streptomyces sp. NBC_01591 TaxID=2975888 RepID=UPI003FA372D1
MGGDARWRVVVGRRAPRVVRRRGRTERGRRPLRRCGLVPQAGEGCRAEGRRAVPGHPHHGSFRARRVGKVWTVVVQDVVLGEELAGYVGLVRTRPLYVVVLAPEPRAVAEREAGRGKSGYGAGWTVEALDRVLREETPRIGLWLDTTGQTVEQTVDAVLAELGRARVVGAAES